VSPAKTFRDAACVVLVRGHGRELETFWVRRGDAVPSQPGFMAFPGGKVDAADGEFPVAGVSDEFERAARVCATREALEETGVLVGVDGAVDASELAAARVALLDGRRTWRASCASTAGSFIPSRSRSRGGGRRRCSPRCASTRCSS
jgi:8-oxo-dGTP pyrophosphatase MutT (NUDIX family)